MHNVRGRRGRADARAADRAPAHRGALPADAAPILRDYLRAAAVTRPFFDVTASSPLADFEAEAPRHPVFRLAAL